MSTQTISGPEQTTEPSDQIPVSPTKDKYDTLYNSIKDEKLGGENGVLKNLYDAIAAMLETEDSAIQNEELLKKLLNSNDSNSVMSLQDRINFLNTYSNYTGETTTISIGNQEVELGDLYNAIKTKLNDTSASLSDEITVDVQSMELSDALNLIYAANGNFNSKILNTRNESSKINEIFAKNSYNVLVNQNKINEKYENDVYNINDLNREGGKTASVAPTYVEKEQAIDESKRRQ